MKTELKILLLLFVFASPQFHASVNANAFAVKQQVMTGNNGNAPVIMLPDVSASQGETVSIPVSVKDFNNIGAISLTLHYNPTSLSYLSYINTSGFPGLIVYSPSQGTIVVAGFNVNPNGFSLNDGSILFTLSFTFNEASSYLSWYDDGSSCEFAGPTPDYLPLNDSPTSLFYQNGSVNVSNKSLNGTVSYYSYGTSGTALAGFTIQLKNAFGGTLSTTTTNSDGYYEFGAIPAGTAYLEVSSPLEWGGVNATDALAALLHAIGRPINFWYPEVFINTIADVNSSGTINATDALFIMKRAIQLIGSFDAGDWAFYSGGVVFENSGPATAKISFTGQSQINIHARCIGDINGSYNFQQTKSLLPITGNSKIEIAENAVANLPLILSSEQAIGAASVFIKYDSKRITILDVKTENTGLIFNVSDGWVNIQWRGLEPLKTAHDGSFATLVVKVSKQFKPGAELFSLGSHTEFADPDCNVLAGVSITIPDVVLSPNTARSLKHSDVLLSFDCFPNPCSRVLHIHYMLQDPAMVEVSISNIFGQSITIHQLAMQEAGQYHHQLNLKEYNLKDGLYLVNFLAKTRDGCTSKTERIIIVTE